MANGHGGKRTPRKPAPASGPGRLSRRTDGGPAQVNAQLPDAGYGEQSEFQEIQAGAPMAAAPPLSSPGEPGVGGGGAVPGMELPVPLTDPTGRPDEPISYGASFGAGPGPLAAPNRTRVSDTLARLAANDESGVLQDLYELAVRKGL